MRAARGPIAQLHCAVVLLACWPTPRAPRDEREMCVLVLVLVLGCV